MSSCNLDILSFDDIHCVAHGGNPDFVGKTLPEIFEEVEIPLNGTKLHAHFRQAAESGGGWVTYDWINLVNSEPFKKISYIFQITVGGKDYYGGIGFNDLRYPVAEFAEIGLKHNGDPIPCSSEYGLDCSEINARWPRSRSVPRRPARSRCSRPRGRPSTKCCAAYPRETHASASAARWDRAKGVLPRGTAPSR